MSLEELMVYIPEISVEDSARGQQEPAYKLRKGSH
jgi:hypothetical protein